MPLRDFVSAAYMFPRNPNVLTFSPRLGDACSAGLDAYDTDSIILKTVLLLTNNNSIKIQSIIDDERALTLYYLCFVFKYLP